MAVFDRLAPHARRVVDLARQEAADRGHNYVGTEHILVALTRTDGVGKLLAGFGCGPEEARAGIVAVIGGTHVPPRDPETLLTAFGINLGEVRRRVEATFGSEAVTRAALRVQPRRRWRHRLPWPGCNLRPARSALLGAGWMGVAPRVKRVLEMATGEAAPGLASPAHLLCAIVEEGEGVACHILSGRGIDLAVVAAGGAEPFQLAPEPGVSAGWLIRGSSVWSLEIGGCVDAGRFLAGGAWTYATSNWKPTGVVDDVAPGRDLPGRDRRCHRARPGAVTMPEPIVILDRVTRRFGAVTALDEVSLEIRPGETVALLGPNGAGKTTAVETLLGLMHADAGAVRVFGGPPANAIADGLVGAMLQNAGLPQGVRVDELIGLIGGLYDQPLPVEDVLELTDLADVARRQVQRLSGGQRQRVRLALALVGRPELVVLDEPTAALDVEARRAFWRRVNTSAADGQTVLFTTHRLEEADTVAGRVVVITSGRVVADGTREEVKSAGGGRSAVRVSAEGVDPERLAVLPGVESMESGPGPRLTLYTTDPDRTVRALLAQASLATGLEVTRAGLEEAFLSLSREGGS